MNDQTIDIVVLNHPVALSINNLLSFYLYSYIESLKNAHFDALYVTRTAENRGWAFGTR